MSLILEALRKSEAERRRGQVPSLHAERAPATLPARAARPAWPWLLLALLAVLATAWLARGTWSPPSRTADPSGDTAGPPVPGNAVIDASYAGVGKRAAAVAVATPLNLPSVAGTPPTPAAPDTAATARAATAPRNADAAAPPVDSTRSATAGVAIATPPAAVAAPPRPSPVPASAPAVAAPAPTATAAIAAAPLRLSELSAAERLELPPLKMSMHMWDPTPAQRFAIIDGARVNEGDRLGEAVVDEITASAVVLAWHGQRLLIPLR